MRAPRTWPAAPARTDSATLCGVVAALAHGTARPAPSECTNLVVAAAEEEEGRCEHRGEGEPAGCKGQRGALEEDKQGSRGQRCPPRARKVRPCASSHCDVSGPSRTARPAGRGTRQCVVEELPVSVSMMTAMHFPFPPSSTPKHTAAPQQWAEAPRPIPSPSAGRTTPPPAARAPHAPAPATPRRPHSPRLRLPHPRPRFRQRRLHRRRPFLEGLCTASSCAGS